MTETVPQGPTSEEREAKELDAAVTWLIGSFATVTAVLAGLGAVNGGLERMLRNHPWQARIAFGLTSLAIALAVMARSSFSRSTPAFLRHRLLLGNDPPRSTQRRLVVLSALAFAIGLLWATWNAVATPGDTGRPSITAKFDTEEGLRLEGLVRASGLKSDQEVTVVVDGLIPNYKPIRLYESHIGPDPAGVVELNLSVPLSPGSYKYVGVGAFRGREGDSKCGANNQGCLLLRVPPVSARPQLSAAWKGATQPNPTLLIDVSARDLRTDKAIWIRVVRSLAKDVNHLLYSSFLSPNSRGEVEGSLELPIPRNISEICAAAIAVEPPRAVPTTTGSAKRRPRCPPGHVPLGTVWARLKVPRTGSPGVFAPPAETL